jgi:hypothetical protein
VITATELQRARPLLSARRLQCLRLEQPSAQKGTSLARRRMIKRAVDESTREVVSPDGLKLCLHDRDLNELYNFRDDPLERQNLCSDRQYASVISRLVGEIHRWQESTDDKLRI